MCEMRDKLIMNEAGTLLDYSEEANWCVLPEITKEVDTFYIYATNYFITSTADGAPAYAPLDNAEMFEGAAGEYVTNASAFAESTNVFVPFYRQAGMPTMKRAWKETGNCEAAVAGMPFDDMCAALDYYFEHYNAGRPFIIAGHSQGSCLTKYVLKHYFKEHMDHYERMVAAYVVGYAVTEDDLEAYPYLRFATGESDTGVIISWNTEGKQNLEERASTAVVLPREISINPINWRRDETYAAASENLGSLVLDEATGQPKIVDRGADAQVNLERGVVITNAPALPMAPEIAKLAPEYFGPDSRHADDYTLYYNNIKENANKRVAAYLASRK